MATLERSEDKNGDQRVILIKVRKEKNLIKQEIMVKKLKYQKWKNVR